MEYSHPVNGGIVQIGSFHAEVVVVVQFSELLCEGLAAAGKRFEVVGVDEQLGDLLTLLVRLDLVENML